METTTNRQRQFKKGDAVYSYEMSGDKEAGRVLVCAQSLTLTSMGKRQGTAVYQSGGRELKRRIYPQTQLVASLEDVKARAMAEYREYSKEVVRRRLNCANEWLANWSDRAKPEVVASQQAERKALLNARPSLRFWIHDGENVTETVVG